MKTLIVSLALGFGVLAAAQASADTLTSRILTHNPATHTIVLSDKETLVYNPQTVQISENLVSGDKVEIHFDGSEGDMSQIFSITRVME